MISTQAGTLATLGASCENNFRPRYAPPPDIAPDVVTAAWKGLEETENAYETSISASYARFVGLEETLGKLKVKMAKCDAFLQMSPPAVFGSADYGETLAEATGLLEGSRLCAQQVEIASEVPSHVDDALEAADKVALHADYAAVVAAKEALAAKFPAVVEGANVRARKLEVAIGEFGKRARADDVLAWIDDQVRLLKLKDEGIPKNSMIEVTTLQLHLDREFREAKALWAGKRDAIVPYEAGGGPDDGAAAAVAGLEARLATVADHWATMEQCAENHGLLLKQRHDWLADLLATKERYSVVAGDLAAKCRVLELFLRTPIFVDSEADVLAATATYEARVSDLDDDGTLASLLRTFDEEAKVLGAKLRAAIDAGEEDAAGAFERYDVPDLSKLLDELSLLSAAYKENLDEDLALEREKERLRLLFAEKCDEEKGAIAECAANPFVFKDWVYKEGDLLEALRQKRVAWSEMKDHAVEFLTPIAEDLAARGVMANPHTSESVTTIRLTYELAERDADEQIEACEALVAEVAKLEERKAEYVESAAMFRDWIDGVTERYRNVAEGAAGFGANSLEVKASMEKFYEYKSNEKVDLQSTVNALTKSLADVHDAQAKVFHDPFSPAAGGLSPKLTQMGLVSAMTALETVDKPYEAALRNAHLRICQIEADLQTMDARLDTCNDFIAAQKTLFDSHNYGDNLAAVNALLENVHLDKRLAGDWAATLDALKALLDGGTMDVHDNCHVVAEKHYAVKTNFDGVMAQAPEYYHSLGQSKMEYEKLATLLEPANWIEATARLFKEEKWPRAASLAKPTVADVQHALKIHDLNYTSRLPTVQKAIQDVSDASTMSRASKRQSIKSCMDEVGKLTMALATLENDADERLDALNSEVEAQADVADKSREYATAAVELDVLYATLEEELAAEPNGSLGLEAVQAQVAAFDETVSGLTAAIDDKFEAMTALATFLETCGYVEAKAAFSRFTVATLADRRDACLKAVVDRGELFKGPGGILDVESKRETLRVDFAAAAQQFRDDTASKAAKIEGKAATPRGSTIARRMSKMFSSPTKGGPKADINAQLLAIQAVKKAFDEADLLAPCEALANTLEAEKVVVNPHTKDNIFTLRAAHAAFLDNYKTLEASLLAQKALEEGRKISPEKLAEIRENFDEFDSTGDGQLSETEFYSGLTSVGIAMTKEKVKENFDKLKDADSGAITFDAFLPFMEEHLTVRGASQSDVLSAFADLLPKTDDDAKAAVISMGMLARCIHDHDLLEYLTTNMPKAEPPKNGEGLYYDCSAFVADLFMQ